MKAPFISLPTWSCSMCTIWHIYITVRKWKHITAGGSSSMNNVVKVRHTHKGLFAHSAECEQRPTFLSSQHQKKSLTWACSCCTTNKRTCRVPTVLLWVNYAKSPSQQQEMKFSHSNAQLPFDLIWSDYCTNMTVSQDRTLPHDTLNIKGLPYNWCRLVTEVTANASRHTWFGEIKARPNTQTHTHTTVTLHARMCTFLSTVSTNISTRSAHLNLPLKWKRRAWNAFAPTVDIIAHYHNDITQNQVCFHFSFTLQNTSPWIFIRQNPDWINCFISHLSWRILHICHQYCAHFLGLVTS